MDLVTFVSSAAHPYVQMRWQLMCAAGIPDLDGISKQLVSVLLAYVNITPMKYVGGWIKS